MVINQSDVCGYKAANIFNNSHDKCQFSVWRTVFSDLFNFVSLSTWDFCCNERTRKVIKIAFLRTEGTYAYL